MNRQQRREMQRRGVNELQNKITLYNEVIKKLDGMTQEEVTREAYQKGFTDGIVAAGQKVVERYYTATMMALHELYGFGQERCLRVLHKLEECIVEHLTDDELSEETKKKLKIEIHMEEGIEKAQPWSSD